MDETTQPKLWGATQAYAFAIICLMVGVITGYFLHAPATGASPVPHITERMPANTPAIGAAPMTPAQLKPLVDKQAEPLLAELRNKPKDPMLLERIGATYFAGRQYQTAQEYYERSATVKPTPAVLTKLSSAYFYSGDSQKAIATLNRALQMDPNYADALFNLGMLRWRAELNPQAAIAAWEKLLKAHPNHPNRAQVEQVIEQAKKHMNIPPGARTDKPAM